MKRLLLTLAAAAVVAGPIAATAVTPAAAQDRWERRDRDNNDRRGGWDRGDRGGDRDGRGDRNGRYDRDGRNDNGGWRGDRQVRNNWNGNQHNGYYYGNRFYYGPPPQAYYGNPYYRPGYSSWRRGGYLPPYYRGYVVNDYGRYHLRRPPRGYHWVQANNDFLLVAIASGIIFDVIINSR